MEKYPWKYPFLQSWSQIKFVCELWDKLHLLVKVPGVNPAMTWSKTKSITPLMELVGEIDFIYVNIILFGHYNYFLCPIFNFIWFVILSIYITYVQNFRDQCHSEELHTTATTAQNYVVDYILFINLLHQLQSTV